MYRAIRRVIWRALAYIRGVHLEVTLASNPVTQRVAVQNNHSLDQELTLFLNREGRYSNGWVPLGEGDSDVFVRYDQIIQVRKNLGS